MHTLVYLLNKMMFNEGLGGYNNDVLNAEVRRRVVFDEFCNLMLLTAFNEGSHTESSRRNQKQG